MDNVVDCCIAGVSSLTLVAAEAVCGEILHCNSTVTALMRATKRRAESEAHSDEVVSSSIGSPKAATGSAFSHAQILDVLTVLQL